MTAAEDLLEGCSGASAIEVDSHDTGRGAKDQADGMDVWGCGKRGELVDRDGTRCPVVLQVTGGRINRPFAVVAWDEQPVVIDCFQACQHSGWDHDSVCRLRWCSVLMAQCVERHAQDSRTAECAVLTA